MFLIHLKNEGGDVMPKIIAKGIYSGEESIAEVVLLNGSLHIELNFEFIELVQNRFNQLLETSPPMGGTYYPPKNSMLAAYSVLESTFFDDGSPVILKVEGDIGKIPTYNIEGIVY